MFKIPAHINLYKRLIVTRSLTFVLFDLEKAYDSCKESQERNQQGNYNNWGYNTSSCSRVLIL